MGYTTKNRQLALTQISLADLALRIGACDDCSGAADFPSLPDLNEANKIIRGGITGFALLKCDAPLSDPSDKTVWETAITANEMIVRKNCAISGNRAGELQQQTLGACQQSFVTGITYTTTITDRADNTDRDVNAFYIEIQKRIVLGQQFYMAFFSCDDLDGNVVEYPFMLYRLSAVKNTSEDITGQTAWTITATHIIQNDEMPLILDTIGGTPGNWSINDLSVLSA